MAQLGSGNTIDRRAGIVGTASSKERWHDKENDIHNSIYGPTLSKVQEDLDEVFLGTAYAL